MYRLIRPLGLVAVFMGVLVAAISATSRLDPFRDVPILREKWNHWLEHKDEYDTVFIGTSRFYRGLKPSVFDQLTAAGGLPTRTFNFGVDAMLAPEDAYVADYILRNPPKNLRWVFLELGAFVDDFDERDPSTVRTAHWHDWRRTWLCIRANLWPKGKKVKWKSWFRSEEGRRSRADIAWTHLRLFISKSLNLGRGAAAVEDMMLGTKPKLAQLGPERDGYNGYRDKRTVRGAALTQYLADLAKRQNDPAKEAPLRLHHQECFDDTVGLIRAASAKPLAVIAPTTGPLRLRPAESSGVPVIDLCDVQAYPELYVPEVRIDNAHINDKGADLFTRMVAARFLQLVQGQPATRPGGTGAPSSPSSIPTSR